jgi:FkbM family methyltransferase
MDSIIINQIQEDCVFFRDDLLTYISSQRELHSPSTNWYQRASNQIVEKFKNCSTYSRVFLGELGFIEFPFFRMGHVTSNNLFGLDELIIFAMYFDLNKENTRPTLLDLGANIGLHSLVASRIGYRVTAYEPDPDHFEKLLSNVERNKFTNVVTKQVAVSTQSGFEEFVRVEDNSTSSHLSSSLGKSPYGAVSRFKVQTIDICVALSDSFDVIKMDVEGLEAKLLQELQSADFEDKLFLIEVGSKESAEKIFNFVNKNGLEMFAQKMNWNTVQSLDHMPFSYREGTLAITRNCRIW